MMFGEMPPWWFFMLALIALTASIYLDWRHKSSRLRWARWVAMGMMVLSILALYAKPNWATVIRSGLVAVVTEGTPQSVIDSLRSEKIEQVTLDEYLLSERGETLLVTGHGLTQWELKEVDSPILFEKADLPEGPLDFSVENAVENANMKVVVALEIEGDGEVTLSGPGIEKQSVKISADQAKVEFTVRPKVSGPLIFSMVGIGSTDTLFSEPIPIFVEEEKSHQALILTGTPSAEWRFLKNYLVESGFGVAEKMEISREVSRMTFSNLPEQKLGPLKKDFLDKFRLLVLDQQSYDGLSLAEKSAIDEALLAGTLGVLWYGDSNGPGNVSMTRNSTNPIVLNGELSLLPAGTVMDQPDAPIKAGDATLADLKKGGLGRIIAPRMINSYTLLLKGEAERYQNLWQDILQTTIGQELRTTYFSSSPFPRVNEPVTVEANGIGNALMVNGNKVALRENWLRPGNRQFTLWPKEAGWQELDFEDGRQFVYIFGQESWPAQKAVSRQTSTLIRRSSEEITQDQKTKSWQPISPWIFYMMFLTAGAFLWIEGRLN